MRVAQSEKCSYMLGIGRFDFGFLKRGLISHVNGWGVVLQFDSLFKQVLGMF